MRHYSKQVVSTEVMLLANIADSLNFLAWAKTKDGEKGRNRPSRIMDAILGKQKQDEVTTFATPTEYESARSQILERLKHGNANR